MSPLTPTQWDGDAAARWRRLGVWKDEPLGETMGRAARRWAERVAIVDGSARITFGELDELTRRLATALMALGVERGDVAAFQLPSWWETVALTIASWRIGAVANPVLPNLRDREMQAVARQAQPRVLVVPERFRGFDYVDMAGAVDHGAHLVVARSASDGGAGLLARLLAESEPAGDATLGRRRPRPDAPALLLYTSGTTAAPKGVIHTHNTLRAEADSVAVAHECSADDVVMVSMPLAHIGGVLYGILLSVVVGLRAVLVDIWDPDEAVRLSEREQVTVYPAVPVFVRGMLGAASFHSAELSSLRLCTLGGARVGAADVQQAASAFGCWCKRNYGSTEMPTLTSGPRRDDRGRLATTDGVLLGRSEVRIVDDTAADVPVGVSGEIWCRGPELFVGYVDAALNQAAFAPGGWYRSGDVGTLDHDGFLTVSGRKTDLIIRGGENISPQEIEAVLLEQPEVADAAVVGMPDETMGERTCAFVIVDDPSFDLATMIVRLQTAGLAPFKLPERLEQRGLLPRTATGKIRKDALREEIAGILARERAESRRGTSEP